MTLLSIIMRPFITWRYKTLAKLINDNKLKTYLEVGVWQGKTLFYLQRHCKSLVKMYAVDPFTPYPGKGETMSEYDQEDLDFVHDTLKSKVDMYNKFKSKIELHRVTSQVMSETVTPGSLDIVFIDAEHTYKGCKNDIFTWLPKVKKGGFLCGHNYEVKYFGIIRAVNEVLGEDNVIIKPDSVWIHVKNG